MRFHRLVTLVNLELIWGRDATSISRYIGEWAPKLSKADLQLCHLDLTEAFLEYSMPESYKSLGLNKVGALDS